MPKGVGTALAGGHVSVASYKIRGATNWGMNRSQNSSVTILISPL